AYAGDAGRQPRRGRLHHLFLRRGRGRARAGPRLRGLARPGLARRALHDAAHGGVAGSMAGVRGFRSPAGALRDRRRAGAVGLRPAAPRQCGLAGEGLVPASAGAVFFFLAFVSFAAVVLSSGAVAEVSALVLGEVAEVGLAWSLAASAAGSAPLLVSP